MPARMSWKFPGLVALLNSYVLLSAPESGASEWPSIQVLWKVDSKPHVDAHKKSDSWGKPHVDANDKGDSWGLPFGHVDGAGFWTIDKNGPATL